MALILLSRLFFIRNYFSILTLFSSSEWNADQMLIGSSHHLSSLRKMSCRILKKPNQQFGSFFDRSLCCLEYCVPDRMGMSCPCEFCNVFFVDSHLALKNRVSFFNFGSNDQLAH